MMTRVRQESLARISPMAYLCNPPPLEAATFTKLSQWVDASGNPVGLAEPGGGHIDHVLDNLDRLTSITYGTAGAGGNTYGYDYAGRLTSWTGPAGATTAYEWDAAGNRTRAGADTFTYDQRN